MGLLRRHLHRTRWLAWLAVAALVLLPTLGHAFAKGGGGFAEVCTPTGMKLVPLDDGAATPDPSVHLEHCVFCAAAAAPPPATPDGVLPSPPAGTEHPPRFLHAPRTPHAWASANPRAPPVLLD